MTKRWSVWALGALGAWCLACSGEVTVNDEPIGVDDEAEEAEEGEEGEEGEDAEEEEADDGGGDGPGRKEVVEALKALDAKVSDLGDSCKGAAGNTKQPVAKWINAQRKTADKTEIGCEGTTCSVKMTGPPDAEWMLNVQFELVDGAIDVDSFECQAAG